MKKIKALMVAFVLAGMTVVSCSSDDSGPTPTIDGKWNQVKTLVKLSGQSITQQYTDNVTGCDKNYIEFAAGGTFNEAVYFKAVSGACQTDMFPAGTWTKADKMLSITNSGNLSGTYEIIKLSNSELQISTDNNEGGVTTNTTVYFNKGK